VDVGRPDLDDLDILPHVEDPLNLLEQRTALDVGFVRQLG
jgi:hypothetical protein